MKEKKSLSRDKKYSKDENNNENCIN